MHAQYKQNKAGVLNQSLSTSKSHSSEVISKCLSVIIGAVNLDSTSK